VFEPPAFNLVPDRSDVRQFTADVEQLITQSPEQFLRGFVAAAGGNPARQPSSGEATSIALFSSNRTTVRLCPTSSCSSRPIRCRSASCACSARPMLVLRFASSPSEHSVETLDQTSNGALRWHGEPLTGAK